MDGGGPTEVVINGGLLGPSRDFPGTGPTVVIDVPSIDDALQRFGGAGGPVLSKRAPVGEIGFDACFTDPEGNLIGLRERDRFGLSRVLALSCAERQRRASNPRS